MTIAVYPIQYRLTLADGTVTPWRLFSHKITENNIVKVEIDETISKDHPEYENYKKLMDQIKIPPGWR